MILLSCQSKGLDMKEYLLPVADGLEPRKSQPYARYKLKALEIYLSITTTSMHQRPWSEMFFLDLQAGPGKNIIGNDVILGSPLIALTLPHPFTQYRFNEIDPVLVEALRTRTQASELANRVQIYQEDVNQVAYKVCDEIEHIDRRPRTEGKWSTLNVAFLDPEGLELQWSTVKRLATIKKMDLIINFSTMGINRAVGKKYTEAMNNFFGNTDWQEISNISDSTKRRRQYIDLYLRQLRSLGYHVEEDPDLEQHDMSMRNSRNAEVYSLIFASKHPLGDKFWRQAKKGTNPPRLPGF
jgi:three-Cys-motif partner protein